MSIISKIKLVGKIERLDNKVKNVSKRYKISLCKRLR